MANWRRGLLGCVVLAGVVLSSGCGYSIVKKTEYARLVQIENEAYSKDLMLKGLQNENAALKARLATLEASAGDVRRLNELLEAERKRLEGELAGKVGVVTGEPTGWQVTATGIKKEVMADALFDSGKSDLKDSGKKALKEIAEKLNNVPNDIEIAGFTDTDPIRVSKWDSNFELSGARAYQVLKFLTSDCGVDPSRIHFAGYGEHQPRDTKQASRRVEVTILYTIKGELPASGAMPAIPGDAPAPVPAPVLK